MFNFNFLQNEYFSILCHNLYIFFVFEERNKILFYFLFNFISFSIFTYNFKYIIIWNALFDILHFLLVQTNFIIIIKLGKNFNSMIKNRMQYSKIW